jgi:hypothetical protein
LTDGSKDVNNLNSVQLHFPTDGMTNAGHNKPKKVTNCWSPETASCSIFMFLCGNTCLLAVKHKHFNKLSFSFIIMKSELKGDFNRKPGCPTLYLLEEENVIVVHVKNMQNFIFP